MAKCRIPKSSHVQVWTLGGSWTTLEETHWTQDERVNSTKKVSKALGSNL